MNAWEVQWVGFGNEKGEKKIQECTKIPRLWSSCLLFKFLSQVSCQITGAFQAQQLGWPVHTAGKANFLDFLCCYLASGESQLAGKFD